MKIIHFLVLLTFFLNVNAQEKYDFLQTDFFYGIALEHDKSLKPAIQGKPYGILLSYNHKNTTNKDWTSYYNYPDFGFSALYQNTNSSILGEIYGLYTHYNFYLNNRNAKNKLQFTMAFGLGYISKPYNEFTNNQNFALSSTIVGSAYLKLAYQREFFKNKLGFNTGFLITHFSNAGVESPNLGLNVFALTVGFNYNLQKEPFIFGKSNKVVVSKNKIHYNVIIRTGINESKNITSGKKPFYVTTFMLNKKINTKSNLVIGLDYFYSEFLETYIDVDNPEFLNFNKNRIGLFVGHELKINKLYAISQIGYNVYYPKKYVSRIYERFGFKYYLNNYIFTELSMKVNLFRAETLEFGLGIKI